MKKTTIAIVGLTSLTMLLFFACSPKSSSAVFNCSDVSPVDDSTALLSFAAANGITPLSDTVGLYYQIVSQGAGMSPILSSTISVTYKGTLLDGTVFDSTGATPRNFVLNTLIPSWQLGLPRIQTGGRIKLLVPSAYGYGCSGNGTVVPPNTPLYFDITLVGVQ
jgi:FKBP-type peptidyl-prolyl cis-trans isomerase FkpA